MASMQEFQVKSEGSSVRSHRCSPKASAEAQIAINEQALWFVH